MNKKRLVTKANDLVEAHYKLDTQEQKLVLSVVSMIRPEDEDFHEYRMSVREFMEIIGVEGKGYHARVRQRAKTLLKKPLVIHQANGNELICNWFSSFKYLKKEGQMVMKFDPDLKPYLLNLQSKFTSYQLKNVVKLKSGYSIRLYELLRQYLRKGERYLSLDDLRTMLGIEPDKYTRFNNFRVKVLEKAEKELPLQTDISFTWEPQKTGRKITGILFRILSTKSAGALPKENAAIPAELLDLIPAEYRTDAQVTAAIQRNMDKVEIESMIRYAVHQCQLGKAKQPFPRYLGIALDKNYGVGFTPEAAFELEKGKFIYIGGRSVQFMGIWPIKTNDREYSKQDIIQGIKDGSIQI